MLGGFGDPADLLSKPGLPVTGCVTWGKFINLSEHGFTQLSNDEDYPRDCDKNQRSSSTQALPMDMDFRAFSPHQAQSGEVTYLR